ncbi:MAG: hypothetical protein AB8V23_05825 [Candidatus Midichloria sp.]|nr:sodium:solute symporter family protein [Hyalomma marginatum]
MTTLFATGIGARATTGTVENICFGYSLPLLVYLCHFFGYLWPEYINCDIMIKLYGNTGRRITNTASIIASIGVVTLHATAIRYILHYFSQVPISFIA